MALQAGNRRHQERMDKRRSGRNRRRTRRCSALLWFSVLMLMMLGVVTRSCRADYCWSLMSQESHDKHLETLEKEGGGSRRGHLIPGTMWILWAAWWYFHVLVYWVRSKCNWGPVRTTRIRKGMCRRFLENQVTSKRKDFHAQAWFEGCFRSTSLLEPIFKAVLPLFAIFLELYFHAPSDICYRRMLYNGTFDRLTANVWLHTCLYAGVCFSGVMDLIVHFEYLPKSFDKATHLLVFINQGMLFAVHLKGSGLSIMMHKILVGLIFAYVVVAMVDFYVASPKNNLVAAILRPFFLCLMGAWIIQTGVVLFPSDGVGSDAYDSWKKKWNENEHTVMMFVPMYLSFFALTIFCVSVLWMWSFTFLVMGHKNAKILFSDNVGKNQYVEL